MIENSIRIEHILVSELEAFADRVISEADPGQFVPISMQRATAHANNPYADPGDIGLLAAIDSDEEVVGYFGILPMLLRVGDEIFKTHWFTTWSVSAKVRGRGVGSDLMKAALTLGKDFLIVGSVHARRVCQKFGFWERSPLTYFWIDVSGMGSLNPMTWVLRLIRKVVHLLKIDRTVAVTNAATRRLDRAVSPLSKRVFYPLLSRKLENILEDIMVREVDQVRKDLPNPTYRPQIELHRGIEAVNWMLKFPWIVESGASRTEGMDYYFSDSRPLYRLIALEVGAAGGNDLGFVVFSVSQKPGGIALKTLDFCFHDPAQYPVILALAVRYARQYHADTVEVPAEIAGSLQNTLLGKLLLVKKTRIYQCHPKAEDSPLAKAWADIELHLYDGDMAFS